MLAQGPCDSCTKPCVESQVGLAELAVSLADPGQAAPLLTGELVPVPLWPWGPAGLGSQVLMTLAQESWAHP